MTGFSRRQIIGAIASAPLLGGAPASLAGATAGRRFDKDKLGVCAHLNDTGSAYHVWPKVKQCMDYIGLRHIRTAAPQRKTIGYNLQTQAASAGYRLTFTIRNGRPLADQIADLEQFAREHPDSIAGIEGPNEIDHSPVSFNGLKDSKADAHGTPAAALAFQSALYQLVKSSAVLRGVPVIAFSDFAQSRQKADFGNAHVYPRNGSKMSGMLGGALRDMRVGGRPIIITEAGFHTLPSARPFAGTDDATQATLVEDAIDAASRAGVARIFIYELIDSYPPNQSMETHFGLFHYDYSPKPVADMFHRLTSAS